MYTLEVYETFRTTEELAETLTNINRMIQAGFTSGFDPSWQLTVDQDEDEPTPYLKVGGEQ